MNLHETFNVAYTTLSQASNYHFMVEAILFLWVLWLLRRKKRRPDDGVVLTHEEEEQIIRAWKPKPLVQLGSCDRERDRDLGDLDESPIWGPVEGRPGKYISVNGKQYLNLATHNYLGLMEEPSLTEEAERCIRKYGVGSCGPRGFYGTVDVHLELEEKIAEFLKLEETALYSYGFSTIASAIPSYSKAGDIIFADQFVNFAIQKGIQASRSIVNYFDHNDAEDLERLLVAQAEIDKKNPKKARTIRRFCIVEGLYAKSGEMCPLKEIAVLCRKYKVRLFVDESISFCTVGKTGRGVTEFLDVPVEDVDLICGSLENGLASYGGFVVGSSFVVDHQRISGLGYCFSASLPPLLAGVGIQSLKLIDENPIMIEELQRNCSYMDKALIKITTIFEVSGHKISPIKHIVLKESDDLNRKQQKQMLDWIINYVKEQHKIALVQPAYLEKEEYIVPLPSIRIVVSRLLTTEEIDKAVDAINEASTSLLFNNFCASLLEPKSVQDKHRENKILAKDLESEILAKLDDILSKVEDQRDSEIISKFEDQRDSEIISKVEDQRDSEKQDGEILSNVKDQREIEILAKVKEG